MRFNIRFQSGAGCQLPDCQTIVGNRQKVIVEAGYAGEFKFCQATHQGIHRHTGTATGCRFKQFNLICTNVETILFRRQLLILCC